jgi:hypothetical protein
VVVIAAATAAVIAAGAEEIGTGIGTAARRNHRNIKVQ